MERFIIIILFIFGSVHLPYVGFSQTKDAIMVGAYYFDGWAGHRNDTAKWAVDAPTHLSYKLKTEYADRMPLWGWRDDNLEIMEQQIDLAAKNGIDFFVFCWYWSKDQGDMDGKRIKENVLHTSLELFMKARNKNKMKFALLIANHQGAQIEGESNWLKAMSFMTDNYFKDSQYFKIENKPVVAFFNAKAASPFVDKMDSLLVNKDFAGLFSISCNDKNKKYSINSWYNIREKEPGYAIEKNYDILVKNAEVAWYAYPEDYHIAPLVMVGWDQRPWDTREKTLYYVNRTPEIFKQHFENAVKFVSKKKSGPKIILIYAWNEYGEGGYLVPTVGDKKGKYLRMIKK